VKVDVRELDTGGRISIEFEATCDGRQCGRLTAHRTKVGGRVVYTVDRVDVHEPYRRQRVATRLYEAAHAEACRRRARLASTQRNPGAHSNDFWRKQIAKGRAELLPGQKTRNQYYQGIVITNCETWSLDGLRRTRGRR
jgi:GNAT superfamily N-acetyltransferase